MSNDQSDFHNGRPDEFNRLLDEWDSIAYQPWPKDRNRGKRFAKNLAILAIIFSVAALAVIFFANHANQAENKRQAEAAQRAEQRAQVEGLAQRWRADQEWESKLAKRRSEVMSVELQQLWSGHSILFVGTLKDILQMPDGSYQVTARHDGVISSRLFIMSSLEVRVACPEDGGKKLLDAHAKESFAVYAVVALVAQITDIIQERAANEDGTTRVGVGKCFDALYLGTNRIWADDG